MAWIKSDSGLPSSDKFLDLVARLKVGPRDVFWNLHNFWFWVSDQHPDGVLKDVSDFVIARQSDWPSDPKAFVDALIGSGFLDRGDGALFVHEWDQWRPDSARLKTRRTSDVLPTSVRQTSDEIPTFVGSALESSCLFSFPVSGKTKDWPLRAEYVEELKPLFPGVDVLLECKKAKFWAENNPSKRKTANGMPRFLMSWMERVQNKAPSLMTPMMTKLVPEVREKFQKKDAELRALADREYARIHGPKQMGVG